MSVQDRETKAEGRVWLITGASSGFGLTLTEAVLAAGDTVVAAVRRPASLDALAAAHPERLVPIAVDVTDTARADEVVTDVVDRLGRIDVLVNNAGRGLVGAVEETSDSELRELMELHFFGPAALTRAALPHMRARKSGAVVQMSSMGGRLAFPGVGAYCATKFALEGLTEALAAEVAAFGIKALIVEPGSFRTGFAGGSALRHTTALPAYEDAVGPVRAGLPASDGHQPGDPVKAAAAILAALDAENTPLRLVLGNDAVDFITAHADAARAEALAWEPVSRGTDFDAVPPPAR
ncbi:oxidoreductase [Streptomyces sp. NPDC048269]|uniref:oxidoreductase n=1 Tax=Streptomyces sp. NPDC048269 TaxID=3155753 RepID=UPI003442611D